MPVTIATWNVNSIKSRLHQLLPWLESARPDIVLVQETKCVDEAFPALEIESLGYNLALYGQKTYNGVAILSKFPLEDIQKGLPPLAGGQSDTSPPLAGGTKGGEAVENNIASPPLSPVNGGDVVPEQTRYIEAVTTTPIGTFRIASVYVPNGQEENSDKFAYKLRFLEALERHIETLKTYGEMLLVGGDYNVAPYDADVYDPKSLYGTVCFHPEEQKRLRRILHAGMLDAFRLTHPEHDGACPYTWWDYRGSGFEHNKGLRIDHLLISTQAADHLHDCWIVRELRGQERPSDHVPVVASFNP